MQQPNTPAPSWLTPTPTATTSFSPTSTPNIVKAPTVKDPVVQLLHTRYRIVFESVVDKMCSGSTLAAVLRNDFREIDPGAFIRWVRKDKELSRRYDEAKEVRTEAWAGRIIEEAEGIESANDVNRSKLIIDTHKWLMGVDNKQYRPTQQVEINNQISITAALEAGMARALNRPDIEGELDEDWG
jgi:hypothetical protein